jgi:L-aspartate oxidase
MGGVMVDASGASTVPGLFACGEVASTGLHGANRLASNSLLEAMAYAPWIAEAVEALPQPGLAQAEPERMRTEPEWSVIRPLMETRVGVVRDAAGLTEAVERLAPLARAGCDAALVGLAVATSALSRQESRGAHWRSDHPDQAPVRHTQTDLAEIRALSDTPAFV